MGLVCILRCRGVVEGDSSRQSLAAGGSIAREADSLNAGGIALPVWTKAVL